MAKNTSSPLRMVTLLVVVALNIALLAFFVLWYIADTASVNAMEDSVGFNQARLLPNSNLMWIAAHASLLLLIIVDVCLVLGWRSRARGLNQVARQREAPVGAAR